jgi:hypothetical protein
VRITRRQLQVALGLFWLLDGALQLQPFMWSTGFATQVIAPAAAGQPHFVSGPVRWNAQVIAAHPLAWDLLFAGTQLLIGVALLVPRAARLALAASVAWSLGVWMFGEGLAGLAGAHPSLLAGAPGAAFLYGLLAVAAWPRRGRANESPTRWLPIPWAVLWSSGAVFAVRDGRTILLVAAEASIGLVALHPRGRPFAAAAGCVLALAIWVVGQDLGGLFTGHATDPNSAPLIALMGVALLATRRPARTRASGEPSRSKATSRFRPQLAARRPGRPRPSTPRSAGS